MQDFAKSTSVVGREQEQPEGEWKIDAGSVLFGVLLGAMVVFAGFKAADYREMQPSIQKATEDSAAVENNFEFEFYELLKHDDLYLFSSHK